MKNLNLCVICSLSLLANLLFCNAPLQADTTLEYCGFHDLTLNMEQLPSSSTPWYGINEDHMWLYNQYMDIYRYLTSDGSWGYNGVNEFGGWPSDAVLYWRPLGKGEYKRTALRHISRAIYDVELPPASGSFEYYISAKTSQSKLVWPAAAPKQAQSVVVW